LNEGANEEAGVESNKRNEEEWQGKRQRTRSRTMTGRSRMTMDNGERDPPHVNDDKMMTTAKQPHDNQIKLRHIWRVRGGVRDDLGRF
jgi:hypothetical protein